MTQKSILWENNGIALQIDIDGLINPRVLRDKAGNVTYADADYSYALSVSADDGVRRSTGLVYESHEERAGAGGTRELRLLGRLDFGGAGPQDLGLCHTFVFSPEGDSFDEIVQLTNRGSTLYRIAQIDFGFRKIIYHRKDARWADGFEGFTLTPVPHRRRFGHRVDRKLEGYRLGDLIPHMWDHVRNVGGPEGRNLPDHGAEGWVWSDGTHGLLVAKFAPDTIEFSMWKGEINGPDVCVRFGGVSQWRDDPEYAAQIAPGETLTFGTSHYALVEGGWEKGYYRYRAFLGAHGKKFPPDYNPPVHWNELYNLSWRLGDGSSRYSLAQLYREAEIAADMGCESLYLDPGWDTIEGSTVWDEKHFGIGLKEFVRTVQERYGIKVSLHLMSHTNSKEEYAGMYRRDKDGALVPCWNGAKVCMQSKWKEEKTRRVLRLAETGVAFFMFDFQEAFPPCCDPAHGHEVPLKRQSHAEGIDEVIRNIKREYPGIYIEAHDRITTGLQDYHPLYFQYDPPRSFDENWGFEYMWDSYLDLISGKAVSLYEYNLACEIPLYLHINIGQKSGLLESGNPVGPDNERMLAFWWYASTVRHLGIGGVSDPDSVLYKKLKSAMKTYMQLQDFYKRGVFYGIDELTHVHVLPDRNQAVINFFNLSGKPVEKSITMTPGDFGLRSIDAITGVRGLKKEGASSRFTVRLEPLSPSLARVNIDT